MDRINAPLLTANPTHDDWKYFKRQLENYLLIVRAVDVQKQPLLLNSLGRDGLDIYDGLPDPKGTYDEAISRFDTYFDGGSSVLIRRKSFFEARQSSSESSLRIRMSPAAPCQRLLLWCYPRYSLEGHVCDRHLQQPPWRKTTRGGRKYSNLYHRPH